MRLKKTKNTPQKKLLDSKNSKSSHAFLYSHVLSHSGTLTADRLLQYSHTRSPTAGWVPELSNEKYQRNELDILRPESLTTLNPTPCQIVSP